MSKGLPLSLSIASHLLGFAVCFAWLARNWGPWHEENVELGAYVVFAVVLFAVWVGGAFIVNLVATLWLRDSKRAVLLLGGVSLLSWLLASGYFYQNIIRHPDAMSGMLVLVFPLFQLVLSAAGIFAGRWIAKREGVLWPFGRR